MNNLYRAILALLFLVSYSTAFAIDNQTKSLLKQGLICFDSKEYDCAIEKWEKGLEDSTLSQDFRKRTTKMLINAYHEAVEGVPPKSEKIKNYSLRGLNLKGDIGLMNDIPDANFNVKLVLYYHCSPHKENTKKHIRNLKRIRENFHFEGVNRKAITLESKKWIDSVIYNVENRKVDCSS